jgi:hypothetical protein
MQSVRVKIAHETIVTRYVCNRGHPHPTLNGASECEQARAAGATDEELYALFDAEVAEFNA